jgi:hypothetical protein
MSRATRSMPMRDASRVNVLHKSACCWRSIVSPEASLASSASACTASAAKRRHSCVRASPMRSAPPWSEASAARMSRYRRAVAERTSIPGSRSLPFETRERAVGLCGTRARFAAGIFHRRFVPDRGNINDGAANCKRISYPLAINNYLLLQTIYNCVASISRLARSQSVRTKRRRFFRPSARMRARPSSVSRSPLIACRSCASALGSSPCLALYEAREKSKVGGTDNPSKRGGCSVPPSTVPFEVFRNTFIGTCVPAVAIVLIGRRNKSEQMNERPCVPVADGLTRNNRVCSDGP